MNTILEQKIKEILHKPKTTVVELFLMKESLKSLMTETYQTHFQESTNIYRARLNKDFIFNKVQDFYSPPACLTALGRANLPNVPVFYCCEIPGFSLLEVKPEKVGQYISLARFKLKKGLNIKMISNGETNKRWKVSGENSAIKFEKNIAHIFQSDFENKNEVKELYKKTATIASPFSVECRINKKT